VWRWLAADPREVVDLAGAGTLAGGGEAPHLGEELRRWRGVAGRRRLVVLARRHATVALGLAVVLEVLAQLGTFPQWVVVAVPLAAFLVSVSVCAARGPSPFALARLLDDKLGLNDRLATALEIEARGEPETPLERRTVADAAALLRAGREDWRASAARPGRGDWSALAGGVAALAVVVAIGALAGGGSGSSGPTEALGPGSGNGGAGSLGEDHRKRTEKGDKKQAAPTGRLHKIEGKPGAPGQAESEAAEEGYRKIPQGAKAGKAGRAGRGAGQGGAKNAPTGHLHESAAGKAGQNEATHGATGSSKGQKEDEHPTVGFNVKGQKKGGNHGRPGNSEVGEGTSKKAAPNGQGDETGAGASEKPGGTPTGTSKAGGEQGTSRQGHATPIPGRASQAVKIQPGYAPARSAKGGKEHGKAGNSQGAGGKARTAQVTGATQVGEEFSFVPAAGGAVPGPSAGLQLNYLESLKWVVRLPW
jgi:hypothetical protein